MLWKVLLVVGAAPFLVALASGMYAAVTGYTGLAILGTPQYGLAAFLDWMVLYSFVYWPTYLIGAALIAVALILRGKEKKGV